MPPRLHPEVERIGRSFRVIGMSTPATIARKSALLLTPTRPGERIVAVGADVVRCSSTVATLLAAGAAAVMVHEKHGRGPSLDEAARIAGALGTDLVTAGELHGRPIPGGIIGNSPRDAARADVAGRTVLFASTNFGAAFMELTAWASEFERAGGAVEIVVLTLANVDAVAAWIVANAFDRIAIGLGGFYDVVSEEDVVLAGDLIHRLSVPFTELDDEARLMVAAALAAGDQGDRLAGMRTNWIGRALAHFGMEADLATVLMGEGLPVEVRQRLAALVPVVTFIDGIPVIHSDVSPFVAAAAYGYSTTHLEDHND